MVAAELIEVVEVAEVEVGDMELDVAGVNEAAELEVSAGTEEADEVAVVVLFRKKSESSGDTPLVLLSHSIWYLNGPLGC